MAESKSSRGSFSTDDVRDLLRLINQLYALPVDPRERKLWFLKRLCELVDARSGTCQVVQERPSASSHVVSTVDYAASTNGALHLPTDALPLIPGTNGSSESPSGTPARRAQLAAWSIVSSLELPGDKLRAKVTLRRLPGSEKRFGLRERRLVEVLHEQLPWMYGLDLPLALPEVASLPPRQRQTLQLLLAGRSEKQTAIQMQVKPNTVHHYVKAIYRHFDVNSRSELLARWVRPEH